MGQELLSMTRIDAKRVLWLMGLMFATIFSFQYFEIPDKFSMFSLFSGKFPAIAQANFPSGNPPLKAGHISNNTSSYSINSTAPRDERGNDEFLQAEDQFSDKSLQSEEDYSGNLVEPGKNSTVDDVSGDELISENFGGSNQSFNGEYNTTRNGSIRIKGTEGYIRTFATQPAVPPSSSWSPSASVKFIAPEASVKVEAHVKEKGQVNTSMEKEKTEQIHGDLAVAKNKSSAIGALEKNKVPKVHSLGLYTISDMNSLLMESRSSDSPIVPRWNSTVDQELQHARTQIENAPVIDYDSNLYPPLFRNVSIFKRSYELMENTLKVYIYREGDRPIFHQGPLQSIYASEGWFMKILESNKRFVTKNPKKAHLFYLPFSSRNLEDVLYVRDSHSHKNLIRHLKNYLDLISAKYPYWNRTGGADHFLAACHDWAPAETRKHMEGCIRALCNSDVREGFVFGKDVSLPETFVRLARNPLRDVGGSPPSKRKVLAFFAGRMHGYLRSILLQEWENKDPAMKISGPLPKAKGGKNYLWHMKNSKYCICAKGYEVNSPRVVEAILYECVPVIISDNFVPPLFEVLDWESFAVFVMEKDIPNLKKILHSIPEKRYREMQMRVKKLQPHFLWHARPVRYDMFHMILHSIWYNRLYQIRPT